MRRSRSSALVLGLVPALLAVPLAGPPASAERAAPEERAPLWRADLPGVQHAPDTGFHDGAVLDPATGDVLTHFHDVSQPTARTRVRRTDGDTGETVWEVGLGDHTSSATEMALDASAPGGGQVVVATQGRLHAVGLDGTVRWSARPGATGDVTGLATNPSTGTTCLASSDWNSRVGRGARATWSLACFDREGAATTVRTFQHRGLTAGPTGLAVDAERNTWYVAGAHVVPGKGSQTVLLAYPEVGRRLWEAARRHRDRDATVTDLVVDPVGRRVLVGGARGGRATLLGWTTRGRLRTDRAWRAPFGLQDLAVDEQRRRVVVALMTRRGTQVRVLRPRGRTLRRFDLAGRVGGTTLTLDPGHRRLYLPHRRLLGLTWGGTPEWRGTERRLDAQEVLVDAARDRVVVLATSRNPYPQLQLSAYPR
ncbi:hypothetical protein [Nocardioides solisilvae]|uniref:hypothetical protein n=1 Tax=Nocardioides solisilvae TaxID=1542435 RepID=UPI000D74CD3B|nr:hypothetical protein [Nocardioides solisilvae]